MSDQNQLRQEQIPAKEVPLRGYTLSIEEVQRILEKLQVIVTQQGRVNSDTVVRPDDISPEEWSKDKEQFIDRAYKVTTTVRGPDGASIYAPTVDQVFTETTPEQITQIFATNRTAFQGQTGNSPAQIFELNFDFAGPPILDGANPTSAPTPNGSYLLVRGGPNAWVSAVEAAVFDVLRHHKNSRSFLHGPFVYEASLLVSGIPFVMASIYFLGQEFSKWLSGSHPIIVGAVYVYAFFLLLSIYRWFFSYLKFAFPIIELTGKYNRPQKHRKGLAWLCGGLFMAGLGKLFFG